MTEETGIISRPARRHLKRAREVWQRFEDTFRIWRLARKLRRAYPMGEGAASAALPASLCDAWRHPGEAAARNLDFVATVVARCAHSHPALTHQQHTTVANARAIVGNYRAEVRRLGLHRRRLLSASDPVRPFLAGLTTLSGSQPYRALEQLANEVLATTCKSNDTPAPSIAGTSGRQLIEDARHLQFHYCSLIPFAEAARRTHRVSNLLAGRYPIVETWQRNSPAWLASLEKVNHVAGFGVEAVAQAALVRELVKGPPNAVEWIRERWQVLSACGIAASVGVLLMFHLLGVVMLAAMTFTVPFIPVGLNAVSNPLPLLLELKVPQQVGSYALTGALAILLGLLIVGRSERAWWQSARHALRKPLSSSDLPSQTALTLPELCRSFRSLMLRSALLLTAFWLLFSFSLMSEPRHLRLANGASAQAETCMLAWPLWLFAERRLLLTPSAENPMVGDWLLLPPGAIEGFTYACPKPAPPPTPQPEQLSLDTLALTLAMQTAARTLADAVARGPVTSPSPSPTPTPSPTPLPTPTPTPKPDRQVDLGPLKESMSRIESDLAFWPFFAAYRRLEETQERVSVCKANLEEARARLTTGVVGWWRKLPFVDKDSTVIDQLTSECANKLRQQEIQRAMVCDLRATLITAHPQHVERLKQAIPNLECPPITDRQTP